MTISATTGSDMLMQLGIQHKSCTILCTISHVATSVMTTMRQIAPKRVRLYLATASSRT